MVKTLVAMFVALAATATAQVPLVMVPTPVGERPVQCSSEAAQAAGRDCAWFYAQLTEGAPVLGEAGLTWHHNGHGWEHMQVNLGSAQWRWSSPTPPTPPTPLTLGPSTNGLVFSDGTPFNPYNPMTPEQIAAVDAYNASVEANTVRPSQKVLEVGRCYAGPYITLIYRVAARLTVQRLYGDPFDGVTNGEVYLLEATGSGAINAMAVELVRQDGSFTDTVCPATSR